MLTLHFDYPSPPSAIALLRLQHVADRGGAVTFVGLDTLGLEMVVPPTLDLLAQLERCGDEARELGLTLRRPSRQPPTLAAHLVGGLADARGLGAAWRMACLQAYWTDDVDLSDEDALRGLASGVGLDEDEVITHLADRVLRGTVRGRMTARRRRGIGVVPVLEADGGVLVSADLPADDLMQLATL